MRQHLVDRTRSFGVLGARSLIVSALLILAWAPAALAAVVGPGETINLDRKSGSFVKKCRVNGASDPIGAPFDCQRVQFSVRRAVDPSLNPIKNRIIARYGGGAAGTSILSHAATGSLEYDFSLAPSTGIPGDETFVDVQVSLLWDHWSNLAGAGASTVGTEIFADVVQVGSGATILSRSLVAYELSNGQGVTDVSGATHAVALVDQAAMLSLKLRAGRDYRVVFSVQATGSHVIGLVPTARMEAKVRAIRISVDEDEYALLAEHDELLMEHDQKLEELRTLIEGLDAKLDALAEAHEEIIRLLLTPHGQRSGELGDFPLHPSGPVSEPATSPVTLPDERPHHRGGRRH